MQEKRVLIAAATELELKPLLADAKQINDQPRLYQKKVGNVEIHILIGGIGTAFMAYKLTKTLSLHKYSFVINAGMNLLTEGEFPFTKNFLHNFSLINNKVVEALPLANGVTVNTLFTNAMGVDLRYEKINPHIETMEGAAVFYVCLMEHVPFVQIRAISNYVGETNKNLWKIPLAVENLHKTLIDVLNEIQ